MRGILLPVGVVALFLGGCFGGPSLDIEDEPGSGTDFSHLWAPMAEIRDTDETRSFVWDGLSPAGLSIALVGPPPNMPFVAFEFQVDAAVGYVEAFLNTTAPDSDLVLLVIDDQGRVACGVSVSGENRGCTAPVPADVGLVTYTAEVHSYGSSKLPNDIAFWIVPEPSAGGIPFKLMATLHPPSHLVLGDIEDQLSKDFVFRNSDTGISAGEPTLGVNSAGHIFAIEGTSLVKSTDDGQTWQDVSPPWDVASFDPMMFLDPWTDRIYTSHLYIACSTLSWSDDGGENWLVNPAACGMPYDDHQKLSVGGPLVSTPAFDGVVYYSFNSFFEGLWVSRSLDGGATWTSSLAVSDTATDWYPYRTGGPSVADRDGNVYIPSYLDKGGFGVVVSNDHGLTWTPHVVGDKSGGNQGIDPGIAVDMAGNAYGAYWGPEGVRVAHSTNKGATWSEPVAVSPPGLKSFVLADATAGDAGRVAVAYLATADTDRGPNLADGWSRWHLYLSMTEDALAADPQWVTTRVTPQDDPVQIGTICTGGIGCFGGNRNLLDFIDIQAGPDGRVYIAYTDGCLVEECVELPQESRADNGVIAVQDEGPRLFVDRAPWASS